MSKQKILTLSALKKLDSQFNQQKIVTLNNGYELSLDLKFRPSVVEEIFNELMELHKITQEDESLKDFPFEKYSQLLLILNFTSLKNIRSKNISEKIQIMNMLIDQNLYKEILDKMEEHCGEQIKLFTQKIFEIMQEKLNSLQQQQEFYDVLNKEIDKQKELEQVEQSEQLEEVEQQEGEEFAESGTAIIGNTEEVTETN
jgi:hypothetical protein